MPKVKQWTAEPDEEVKIPEEISKKFNYKVLYRFGDWHTVAWCEAVQYGGNRVYLTGAVVDTSDRVNGILLKRRMTFRGDLTLFGVQAIVFPIDKEGDDDNR